MTLSVDLATCVGHIHFEVVAQALFPMAVEQAAEESLAGGLGGLACVSAGQPLDTVKVKLQAFPGHYKSAYGCAGRTYRQGGLAVFYAGSSPAFMTNLILLVIPCTGLIV